MTTPISLNDTAESRRALLQSQTAEGERLRETLVQRAHARAINYDKEYITLDPLSGARRSEIAISSVHKVNMARAYAELEIEYVNQRRGDQRDFTEEERDYVVKQMRDTGIDTGQYLHGLTPGSEEGPIAQLPMSGIKEAINLIGAAYKATESYYSYLGSVPDRWRQAQNDLNTKPELRNNFDAWFAEDRLRAEADIRKWRALPGGSIEGAGLSDDASRKLNEPISFPITPRDTLPREQVPIRGK